MRFLQNVNLKGIASLQTRSLHSTPIFLKAKQQNAQEETEEDFGDDLIGGTTEDAVESSDGLVEHAPSQSSPNSTWRAAVDYLSPKLADGKQIDPTNRPKASKVVDALVQAKNPEEIDIGIDLYRRWQSFKLGVNRNAHGQILNNLCKQGRSDIAFEFLSDFQKFNLTLPDRTVARTLSLSLHGKKDENATPLQLLPILRAFHYRPHDAFCVANAIRSLEQGDEMRIVLLDWIKDLDIRRVIPVEVSQLADAQKIWSDLRVIAEEEGKAGDWLDTLGNKLMEKKSKSEKYAERKVRKQQQRQS